MGELPRNLRWYLRAINVACVAVVAFEVWHAAASTSLWRQPPTLLLSVVVFGALAFAGHRTSFRRSSTTVMNLATPVTVAAVLLFPSPFPVLLTLVGIGIGELTFESRPLYKREYNVAHVIVTLGIIGFVCNFLRAPSSLLRGGHVLSAMPCLLLVLVLFYVIDVAPLLGIVFLLDGRRPWAEWKQTHRRTVLIELSGGAIGVLVAACWRYDPVLLVFSVVSVLALRFALTALQTEDQAVTLRRRGKQLELVLGAVQNLHLEQSRADLLRPIIEAAAVMTGASTASVYLRDEEDPSLVKPVVTLPPGTEAAMPAAVPVSEVGEAIEEISDGSGLGRAICVPLGGNGESGVLWLAGVRAELSAEDHDALAILATQASIALQNARLHDDALMRASCDGLTGLLNHRAFQSRLESEVALVERQGQPLALMMMDLDDFHTVNNAYGHQVGDAMLVAIAALLQAGTRTSDIVARYGGDEFAVILPSTEIDVALAIAERLRTEVAEALFPAGDTTVRVHASIGVAVLAPCGGTREELIRAADEAAYAAKRAGKDRVCRVPHHGPAGLPLAI